MLIWSVIPMHIVEQWKSLVGLKWILIELVKSLNCLTEG